MGAKGRAWRKAYDSLKLDVTKGQRLTLDLIAEAVELADAHLKEVASPSKSDARVNAAAAGASTAPAAGNTPSKSKAKTWRDKQGKCHIKELEAKLAAKDEPRKGGKPVPSTKDEKAGGRPDRPGAFTRHPVCATCKDRHVVRKCLKDKVKAAREALAEMEAKLKKQEQ